VRVGGLHLEDDTHRRAARVRAVQGLANVGEARALAATELDFAHEQVDVDAKLGMLDDLSPLLAAGRGAVLGLPMEGAADLDPSGPAQLQLRGVCDKCRARRPEYLL
jgi:hypothetical protein